MPRDRPGWTISGKSSKIIAIVVLSLLITTLSGLYYRGVIANESILLAIFILPLTIALIQSLDHTIFQLTNKISLCHNSVNVWGNWIRESDLLERKIKLSKKADVNEAVSKINSKYQQCMETAAHVPNHLFLKYKKKFRYHRLQSKEIDSLQLNDFRQFK
ncbi:MAG: hypothetical protein F4X92_04300 [Gammaproteobacteria bacterium]|nr:hypothetical protein [Gammaproteobacteria bacterium]